MLGRSESGMNTAYQAERYLLAEEGGEGWRWGRYRGKGKTREESESLKRKRYC